jgi:hypothetical protein
MNNEAKVINPDLAQFPVSEILERTIHSPSGFATVENDTLWSDVLQIELASGQKLKGIRDRIIINVEGILIWIGHIEGEERSNDVFLTMQENDKTGEITIDKQAYRVKTKTS